MPLKKFLVFVAVAAFVCLSYGEAFAAVPTVPSGENLEAQAARFQQENSIETRSRQQSITKALIEAEEEQKSAAGPSVTFVLHDIHMTGATVFDPQYFNFIWKPYLGKKVSYDDLNNIVNLIKRVYKDLGLLTTTAYLPPQDIKDGVVEIRVVEGKRGSLSIEGNKWFSTPSIAKYFHTYQGEVLDMGEVEKDMIRLNQDKDLNVSSILSPGENPETIDVTLKAKENPPYHVSIGTDNQGTRLTGTFRRLVNISTTNLTGNEDTLAFNGAYTDSSAGYYLSYQAPIGSYGTKLGVDTGYFEGRLNQEYRFYDITNYTQFFNPNVSFDLYETQTAQVDLRTGMEIEKIIKKQQGAVITDENLRLPYVALDMIKLDSMGQTSFSPQISFSAPGFLGASREDNMRSSRPSTDGFFTKYNQYVTRNQNMPWGSYLQVQSQFQAATKSLPTSEQLQLGGEGSVRGYPQRGDFLADVGGDLDTTWYFPMYLIPNSWQWYGTKTRNDIEPLIFYDMGGGDLLRAHGEVKSRFLAGAGGGIMIRIKGNFYLKMEWAWPVGNKPIHGAGPSSFDVSFQAGV